MNALDRRSRSRAPLKVIMTVVLLICALWLADLYTDPTWAKIQSFLIGYFLGTFVMEWVWQRTSRGIWGGAEPVRPEPVPVPEPLPPSGVVQQTK